MASYEQIEQVNSLLSTIPLGKGPAKKDYVMVPQRVKAFRMLYPEGFILTDIISHENNLVVMQAKAGYYDVQGNPVVLGSGLAFEERGKGMVNGTSYIENCETSAVGRALGFLALGIDGGGICSAEELVNAITAQNQMQEKPFERPAQTAQKPAQAATVSTGATVPAAVQQAEPAPETPASYVKRMIGQMKQDFGANFDFMRCRQALIDGGAIPDMPSATMTMDQAKGMINAFYEAYGRQAG